MRKWLRKLFGLNKGCSYLGHEWFVTGWDGSGDKLVWRKHCSRCGESKSDSVLETH